MNEPLAMLLDYELWGAPMLAGLLIVMTHVTFGREVLARGIIFIDLTLAQIAAIGVVVAGILHIETLWVIQTAAVTAALLAAGILAWTERHWPKRQEALIGAFYVVAASLVLILIADSPHGAEQLNELLAGQILWLQYQQLIPIAALYAGLLLLWFTLPKLRQRLFYALFAILVTSSVQLVGLYLVFASLVLPALAVTRVRGTRGLLVGWFIGLLGYALGIGVSLLLDWPTGPAIVCGLAVTSLVLGLVISRLNATGNPQAD